MDRNIKLTGTAYYILRGLLLLPLSLYWLGVLELLISIPIVSGDLTPPFWQSYKPNYLLHSILIVIFFIPMSLFKDYEKIVAFRTVRLLAPLLIAITADFIVRTGVALTIASIVILVDQFLISIASKFQFKF